MKKKLATIIICAVLAVAMMLTLVACNENYKQDAVATDLSDATVASNGGLAVQVGKYLYFINGYAAVDGENDFGEAVKGAIMRVELEAGSPKAGTLVTIVPKNVYNTNKEVGLTVYGDYIYYTCPSVEKGSDGAAKTANMWIMRTKLDGTDTQVLVKLEDYTTNFRIAGGSLVYLDAEYNLHSLDLNAKKIKDVTIVEEISSAMLTYDNLDSDIGGIFFVKRAENSANTNNEIWVYANGENKKVIDGKASYTNLAHPNGYTLSILDVQKIGSNVRLVYTKTDSGSNTTSKGDYYYDFDASFTFDATKEVRMTSGVNYTAYNFFDGNNVLATDSDSIDFLRAENGAWVSDVVIKASSATLLKVATKDNAVYATYLSNKVVYEIKVLDKVDNAYSVALSSAKTMFNTAFSADWQGLDMVGDCIYFFNSDVKNNTYYLDLSKVVDRSNNSLIATKLGKFSAEDNYAMLEGETEDK
ncbi:MAG: hypothetical protein IJ033_05485 [Clostridia bacterium]|nr:hypothetical protein [Clostridia bacterium]